MRLRRATSVLVAAGTVALAASTLPAVASPGQVVLTAPEVGAGDLTEVLLGDITNTAANVSYTGDPSAAGVFSGMDAAGISEGIVLSTGRAEDIVGPNTGSDDPAVPPETSTDHGRPGDDDLSGLAGYDTTDAATLEFDFVPETSRVRFRYVFGSEEYPDFVGSQFNDVFGLYVNGSNCATIDDRPVSVNSVNNRVNPELYVDNPMDSGDHDVDFNGFTVPLTCVADVVPGEVNRVKLAIADGSDAILDSSVLIETGAFEAVNEPPVADPVEETTEVDVPVPVTLSGSDPEGSDLTYDIVQAPNDGTLSGTAPDLTFTPDPGFSGVSRFTYTVNDGELDSAPAPGTITVVPNLPPTAEDVAVTTPRGVPVATTLSGSDPEGEDLTYAIVDPPTDGTLSGDAPDLTFTPTRGFTGVTTYRYTVNDGRLDSEPATVTITVTDVPGSPDPAGPPPREVTPPLPDSGGPSAGWLGLGALLVAAGSALVVRRRGSGRPAA